MACKSPELSAQCDQQSPQDMTRNSFSHSASRPPGVLLFSKLFSQLVHAQILATHSVQPARSHAPSKLADVVLPAALANMAALGLNAFAISPAGHDLLRI